MDRDRELLRHFLAAIAYRFQKAVRGAPPHYPEFHAGHEARTPVELVRHMTSLMGYTCTFFRGGSYPMHPEPLLTFQAEVERFHEQLQQVATELEGAGFREISPEQLLQGPFADAMTHVGQLAMLRRLADAPVPPENFIHARIDGAHLGADQAAPASPDEHWPERPK